MLVEKIIFNTNVHVVKCEHLTPFIHFHSHFSGLTLLNNICVSPSRSFSEQVHSFSYEYKYMLILHIVLPLFFFFLICQVQTAGKT